ncbi:NAD(P)/FAD-dependent oxidoreductase [Flavobacterium silvaticum]|uniref:FAD-binding oxidoreductase n=1 Tax=Flavobacterium silvaticum TaxID=1852020 RepID=A0A972FKN5_9FLAO|nr:FAD-dependent oxidoreductase [Flavobacterium silvaticum]NMH27736.1 FAD-binding oxidoreductase [Flavobacterium silvaticum]
MKLSFWEIQSWFTHVDYVVAGSGIVGLNTALELKSQFPASNILIIEKGSLPEGASTKNAGFACFGSLSEIMDDLSSYQEETLISLIQRRWDGLQLLRKNLGDEAIDFKPYGGYELFLEKDELLYSEALSKLPFVNEILRPFFKSDVFSKELDRFGFGGIQEYVLFNPFEAQIDTGKMMRALLDKAVSAGIRIMNGQSVTGFHDHGDSVSVALGDFSFKAKKLLFATNGFAGQLTKGAVKPARAQVLVTSPIKNLDIKGTFHFDRGYYYFRNIGDRILFGGGRNTDFETESTDAFDLNQNIQNHLEHLLKEVILPNKPFSIEHKWSGIMGMGSDKQPIIEKLSVNVCCGVRLGGMGVAIGSLVGQELARLCLD